MLRFRSAPLPQWRGKLRAQRPPRPCRILQILSVTVFEKTPILEGFSNFSDKLTDADPRIQLNSFDF
jgi:hypothetical protein